MNLFDFHKNPESEWENDQKEAYEVYKENLMNYDLKIFNEKNLISNKLNDLKNKNDLAKIEYNMQNKRCKFIKINLEEMIEKKSAFHNTLLILNNEMLNLSSLITQEKVKKKANNNDFNNISSLKNEENEKNNNLTNEKNINKQINNKNKIKKIPPLPNNKNKIVETLFGRIKKKNYFSNQENSSSLGKNNCTNIDSNSNKECQSNIIKMDCSTENNDKSN